MKPNVNILRGQLNFLALRGQKAHFLSFVVLGFSLLNVSPASACFQIPPQYIIPAEDLILGADAVYRALAVGAELTPKATDDLNNQGDNGLNSANLDELLKSVRTSEQIPLEGDIRYDFRVLDTLYGLDEKEISVFSKVSTYDYVARNYDHHSEQEFWTNSGGRSEVESDCSIKPRFDIGKVYLIIMAKNPHVKAFEKINTSNDHWLVYVRDALDKRMER